jgi:hypothetical protein
LAISNDNHSTWNEQVLCKFKKQKTVCFCCVLSHAVCIQILNKTFCNKEKMSERNVIRVTYGWPPRNDEYLEGILNAFM